MDLWEREACSGEGLQHRSGCASAALSVPCASPRQKDFCCLPHDAAASVCLSVCRHIALSCSPHSSLGVLGKAEERAKCRFCTPGASRSKRGLFSFPGSFACRSEQGALSLPAVLLGRASCSGLSPALPLQNRWKRRCLIPAAFPKPLVLCVWLLCWGVCLGFPVLLGDALAWDGVGVAQGLSGGQIAISKLQDFFMKPCLTSRGHLEVMGSCCLQ